MGFSLFHVSLLEHFELIEESFERPLSVFLFMKYPPTFGFPPAKNFKYLRLNELKHLSPTFCKQLRLLELCFKKYPAILNIIEELCKQLPVQRQQWKC